MSTRIYKFITLTLWWYERKRKMMEKLVGSGWVLGRKMDRAGGARLVAVMGERDIRSLDLAVIVYGPR